MALAYDFAIVLLAATGPVTAFIESAAVSIGAGMLLGGFLAGLRGLLTDGSTADRERWMVEMSSSGGLVMALCLAAEASMR